MPRQSTASRPDIKPLQRAWKAQLDDYLNDVTFSPDNKRLITACADGRLTAFDRLNGDVILSWHGHDFGALIARWSHDGAFLASSGQDGKVSIYDGPTLQRTLVLDHGSDWVEHLAWAPKQHLFVTAAGKSLRMWSAEGKLLEEFPKHESTISGLQWNPNATDLFATACYGSVKLWRIGTSKPTRQLKWKGSLLNVLYAPNGKVIACGCQDGAVHFWTMPGGQDLEMHGYPTKVRELSWDCQSRFLATGGGDQPVIWDFAGKGPEGTRPTQLAGHKGFLSYLSYQPKGKLLASGGTDGRIFLWSPQDQTSPLSYVKLDSEVSKLCWSPDSSVLASGTSNGQIAVWWP